MASPVERAESAEKGSDSRYLAADEVPMSPTESREAASRLVDDLELLRAERLVSKEEYEQDRLSASKTRHHAVPHDAFNEPPPESTESKKQAGSTALYRLWVSIKKFPRFIRYFVYMTPVAVILLTPILLDLYALQRSDAPVGGPGGVKLLWFGIWLETVWLSLWVCRILCAVMPPLFGFVASGAGSSNSKKWRDIGYQLEFDTALFLWMLAVLCSDMPIFNIDRDGGGNWSGGSPPYIAWIDIVNKVIIALFVLASLNFAEKILIQWIATSFHMRTYAYRIENNKREVCPCSSALFRGFPHEALL